MTEEMKPLPTELIDALLANYKKPEDLIGQNGLLKPLTKALVERALQAELTDHLGHYKNQFVANEAGNTRNGRSKKTLKGDLGELPIEIPRDRAGTFEPQIITVHEPDRVGPGQSHAERAAYAGQRSGGGRHGAPPTALTQP